MKQQGNETSVFLEIHTLPELATALSTINDLPKPIQIIADRLHDLLAHSSNQYTSTQLP